MACACKVNQQLSYIEKHYGVKSKESKSMDVRGAIKRNIRGFFIHVLLLPVYPLWGLVLLLKGRKPIRIDRLVKKNA